jgi:putative glutamine amidotransferase
MSDAPLIALVPNRKPNDYVLSLERAGARPLVISGHSESPRDILKQVAGVVLPGGGDIDPARYGAANVDPTFDPAEEGRDEFETEIIRLAIEQDVPLLAICRGVQVLNVALGGTLIQDIPTERPGPVNHRVTDPKWAIAHGVTVDASSRLHAVLRDRVGVDGTLAVNSRHHQSIKDVAPALRVTAMAPDGIIEAVERPGSTYCLGVQWHPENFVEHGEFAALFRDFVITAGVALKAGKA